MDRVMRNGTFTMDWNYYSAVNAYGEVVLLRDGHITVYVDVFTEEMYSHRCLKTHLHCVTFFSVYAS